MNRKVFCTQVYEERAGISQAKTLSDWLTYSVQLSMEEGWNTVVGSLGTCLPVYLIVINDDDEILDRYNMNLSYSCLLRRMLDEHVDSNEAHNYAKRKLKWAFKNPEKYDDYKLHKYYGERRSYLSKKPSYKFDGNKKWFNYIYCEVPVISRYANVEFIKEHYNEFCKYIIDDLSKNRSFLKFGIPINVLKIEKATLRKDGVLDFVIGVKDNGGFYE